MGDRNKSDSNLPMIDKSTEELGGRSQNKSSALKWALIGVGTAILVIATVTMVGLIFIRISQLESQMEQKEDTLVQLEQQSQITPTDPKKPIIEELSKPARPIVPQQAWQSISFSRDLSGPSTYTVSNWLFDDWVYDNPDYEIIDNAYITIKTEGIYTIQAQVSFRMKTGMATYQVKKKTVRQTTGKPLSQCIKTFDKKYSQQDSCFTSITSYLKPGDQIYVDILEDNFTVDFNNGKSTFSALKIQDLMPGRNS